MDDACTVGFLQPLGYLRRELERFVELERSLGEPGRQRLSTVAGKCRLGEKFTLGAAAVTNGRAASQRRRTLAIAVGFNAEGWRTAGGELGCRLAQPFVAGLDDGRLAGYCGLAVCSIGANACSILDATQARCRAGPRSIRHRSG